MLGILLLLHIFFVVNYFSGRSLDFFANMCSPSLGCLRRTIYGWCSCSCSPFSLFLFLPSVSARTKCVFKVRQPWETTEGRRRRKRKRRKREEPTSFLQLMYTTTNASSFSEKKVDTIFSKKKISRKLGCKAHIFWNKNAIFLVNF